MLNTAVDARCKGVGPFGIGDYELSEALFVTQSGTAPGVFHGVRYVQRVNTHGGMPKSRCVEAQKDKYLRIPFTAEFVFYK